MKTRKIKKNVILIPGIASILVLITVQAYIIIQIWGQKDELFRIRYRQLAMEALEYYEEEYRINGFDTALYLIDYYAAEVLRSSEFMSADENELGYLNSIITNEVRNILNQHQYFSDLLSNYFVSHRFEGNISTYLEITSLELIGFDTTFVVYVNRDPSTHREYKSKILVTQFINEDNHFKVSFNFFIDITNKRTTILGEMFLSLSLSILSIVVVVIIFILAYYYLKEERRLSDLKTDFINNMTHELKTPLSTITVASKTLEFDKIINDREKIIETARLIGKQSISLNQLINLILEISIWERTEFEPEMKQVAIGRILNDIIDSFRAGNRDGVEILTDISLEGLIIRADVTYFTTMINNLLLNAVKYSPENPRISIKAYFNGSEIKISVSDNGMGIDKAYQKLVFDKFFRISHGDIHKTKGLGLGLYYVKRIAESHGGHIELFSQPGKGSTFTIVLPPDNN